MGLFEKIKKSVQWVGEKLVQGVATVVDCTLEVCQDIAQATADGINHIREKIERWKPKNPPVDPVFPSAKAADAPLVERVNDSIKQQFPNGIRTTSINSTEEEKVKHISELVPKIATAIGIEQTPDLEFFVPENTEEIHTNCGAYNWAENKLKLNLAMIVNNAPELYEEQVCTVAHELIHARQREAVNAWANEKSIEKYGYPKEYVQLMAYNFIHYISPYENPEAYSKQPVEAEAFWFEYQIKNNF